MARHSTPPVAPRDIADALRRHFREIPVDLVCQRADREEGKRARTEASAVRIELRAWLDSVGWKR